MILAKRFLSFLALSLALASSPSIHLPVASAQARRPSQSEMAMARRLFQAGLVHARAGEWEPARESFERSYAVAAVPVTLLNLAGAQAQTGRLVAGLESYRNFVSSARDSQRAARYLEQARQAIARLEPRIAHVTLRVDGLLPGDELRLGDTMLGQAVLGGDLPVDPGEAEVVVLREGERVAHETLRLREGQSRALTLVVPHEALSPAGAAEASLGTGPEGPADPIPPQDGEPSEGRSIVRSPWLWTGVGVVVASAVVAGVLVASSGSASPYGGNLGSGGATFR